MQTGTALALVDVNLAVCSREPSHTGAGVLAHLVPTGARVGARVAGAFVNVCVAVLTCPAFEALAFVGRIGDDVAAVGVVLTRV